MKQTLRTSVVMCMAFVVWFGAARPCWSKPAPCAAWSFADGAGRSAKDVSSGGNDATLKGPTWTELDDQRFLSFDGKDDFAIVRNSPSLQVRSAFTIEVWARPRGFGCRHQTIMCKGRQFGAGHYWFYLTSNSLSLEMCDGKTNHFREHFSRLLRPRKWSHVAVTFDHGAVSGYVNGKPSGQWRAKVRDVGVCSEPLRIGAYAPRMHLFNGLMSDLRIYPVALSAAQIAQRYSAGRARHVNKVTQLDRYLTRYFRVGQALAESRYEFVVGIDEIRYGLECFGRASDRATVESCRGQLAAVESAFRRVYEPLASELKALPRQPGPEELAAARLTALDERIHAALPAARTSLRPRLATVKAMARPILQRPTPPPPARKPGWDRNIFPRVMSCGRPNWTRANMHYFLAALKHLKITLLQDDYRGRTDDLKQRFLEADERYGIPFVDCKTAGNEEWVDYLDAGRRKMKEMLAREFAAFGRYRGFAGVEVDEPTVGDETGGLDASSDATAQAFRRYLRGKYSAAKWRELGVADLARVRPPGIHDRRAKQVLWTEWQFCKIALMKSFFADLEKLLHETRPDLAQLMVIQRHLPSRPQRASYVALAQAVNDIGIDIYKSGDISEAFMLDLLRSAARRHAMLVVGTCYDRTASDYARDVAIPLAHGTGLWIWCWEYQTRVPLPQLVWTSDLNRLWTWKEGMWDVTERICDYIAKVEPYLVNTLSGARLAFLYSERTGIVGSGGPAGPRKPNYFDGQLNIYKSLVRRHEIFAPVFMETLTEARLGGFAAAIAADAHALTPDECELLRRWVSRGGVLVATATTSIWDQWGRPLQDYALSDLFGAARRGAVATSAELTDETLGKLRCATHDRVQPTTARVLARWSDGDPALLVNEYGKGKVLLLTATDNLAAPSVNLQEAGGSSGQAVSIGRLARKALQLADCRPRLNALACPPAVEVNLHEQPRKRRLMVHFLNWSRGQKRIAGVRVSLRAPDTSRIKAFYPDDHSRAEISVRNGAVVLSVRPFVVHELVVVEY